jgi:alpha-L-fucosidase 2
VVGAATNYDQLAGNAESDFSFVIPGSDADDTNSFLGPIISAVTSPAASKAEGKLREAHIADYQSLAGQFGLELPDTAGSSGLETSVLINQYNSSGPGDPYLESTLFALGRHLFISSTRENSLPANLAGRWSETLEAAWGGDYHSNINFQMNHWGVDQTGLGNLQVATWNYIQNTWVPRGTETAQLLYGAPGWVTHDEMNIFGHTAMKDTAQWANYPASAAWMMQHVSDHFSYSQNVTWYREQGYPLLKGVAEFWLSQLQPDEYFHDGSLVVNPCNSPEHGPTTFACTHYQQLIHQLFTTITSAQSFLPATEKGFIAQLETALQTLDQGLHIGTWGEVKEWKIPDSFGYDFENDTHRHLSNLIGWYPGYSLSSFLGGYKNETIQTAVATTLYSRGPGNGPDANAGWEKVWRSACWARLNNTDEAYFELRYAIYENFALNGLSMYSGKSPPFQIDANFGLVGAVLSMLVVDLPSGGLAEDSVVVLGPAIPESWGSGSVKGLRLRGGGQVDFTWDAHGLVSSANTRQVAKGLRIVNKEGTVLGGRRA